MSGAGKNPLVGVRASIYEQDLGAPVEVVVYTINVMTHAVADPMPVCRCVRCDAPLRYKEEWREPTADEIARYPHVDRHRPRVAAATCAACPSSEDVLAIEPGT